MGGRGATSSSGKMGAMGGATLQPQVDSNAQVDTTQVASAFSADYNAFMAMTDDEKADFIEANMRQGVPAHLAQNDFQKFIYNSGLNERPDLVDDATLDSMTGTELFRTVNNVHDKQNDIGYTADQIANQLMKGRVTRVSDKGGSAYGRGLYFADNYSDSADVYGNTRGNIKATAVMRAKLNNNAKVMNYSQATKGALQEISNGTKLGKVLKKCDYGSAESIYAMAKGYNVLAYSGYFNVLNRNAITMSLDVKPKGSKWK